MIIHKNNYGFSLLEVLIVITLLSILSFISITSFEMLVRKNKTKLFEEEASLIYYSFVERINEFSDAEVIYYDDSYQICYYPYRAIIPSGSGEYVDDFDYNNFNKMFISKVFEDLEEFKSGTLSYNKVNYTSRDSIKENILTYHVPSKGDIILEVMMRDATYTSYDTLTIVSITYNDLIGNSKTYRL